MRVVVPCVGVPHWEVTLALREWRQWTALERVGHSNRAYFDLLSAMWDRAETFAVVEHDIVVNPDTLDELAACPHDWCALPYPYGRWGLHYGLGCVKFGADLIARNPDAMRKVGVMSDANHPRRHWCRLDAFLQGVVLPDAGEVLHKHDTPVGHLGHGCAHGCIN